MEVCTLPVYRPVIGFDKQEIVDVSLKIGTYETSILPFEDCCTIFVAKHPVTKPNINVIHSSERRLEEKIDQLVETALETRNRFSARGKGKTDRSDMEANTKTDQSDQGANVKTNAKRVCLGKTLMVSDDLCALSRCLGSG